MFVFSPEALRFFLKGFHTEEVRAGHVPESCFVESANVSAEKERSGVLAVSKELKSLFSMEGDVFC